ncbi:hypothetical protein Cni_G23021 [Canna indica]|uniref:Uncharacterized protein n=1 Tax=Canna indica TaxID=4628 RepID=A0AAQ3QIT7_9LILI|nr:hypothetical protein Cni_G23021 [Canna indica]
MDQQTMEVDYGNVKKESLIKEKEEKNKMVNGTDMSVQNLGSRDKVKKKIIETIQGDEVNFMAISKERVQVLINLEKRAEDLHRNLSYSFVIAVNRVKERIVLSQEGQDPDMISDSPIKGSRIRKPVCQSVHAENFPFNIKNSKVKKNKFSNYDKVIESDGDLLRDKGDNTINCMLK